MPEVRLIAAIDSKNGIAKSEPKGPGIIPWDLPTDRQYFRETVRNGPVVMGWNTYVASGRKPIGAGENIIFTHKDVLVNGATIIRDGREYFKHVNQDVWVVGGSQIYQLALPYATELYITRVYGDYDCDSLFPDFSHSFEQVHTERVMKENNIEFQYQIWKRM